MTNPVIAKPKITKGMINSSEEPGATVAAENINESMRKLAPPIISAHGDNRFRGSLKAATHATPRPFR